MERTCNSPRGEAQAERGQAAFDAVFGDKWRTIDPRIPCLTVENINDSAVKQRLDELQPDLLLDHGTSIVSGDILDTAHLSLNLHWGLSPYYRGTACTEWALINQDARNIGVTIHELSNRIDGGRIAGQRRIHVRPDDSVMTVNCRLTVEGTKLLTEMIARLARGEELRMFEQDATVGFLYLKRHFSKHLHSHVRDLMGKGSIAKMADSPARVGLLPIVEFAPEGEEVATGA